MTNGTSNGGGGYSAPGDYSWIGDIVEQALMSQANMAQMRQDTQHDPCGMAAYLREVLAGVVQDQLDLKWSAVRQKAQFLPLSIQDSIERLGNMPPGSDLAGGKRLAEQAVDTLGASRLIPTPDLVGMAFLLGPLGPGPLGLAHMDFIEDRMPSGQDIANGSYRGRMSNTGTQVSAGVYIKNGTYRGSKIRQLIERWIEYQSENVTSPDLADARSDLVRMVGSWTGSGEFGIWREQDGVAAGSELGNVLFMESEMLTLEAEARAICEDFNQLAQDRQDAALAGQLGAIDQQLATSAMESERRQRRNDLAVVGALLVGALLAVRATK
jgi:hypothetical protein